MIQSLMFTLSLTTALGGQNIIPTSLGRVGRHYTAHIDLAFDSVENILRQVNSGYFLKYAHANGASIFFALAYIHIARGIYFRSYLAPRAALWWSGCAILVIMMATAFLGYVLPWAQMSFWGATVITNMLDVIPFVGTELVQLLWGGYSVDNPTLQRFYSLHYLLPFILAVFVVLHFALLHEHGSTNPLGIESKYDTIRFHPYFSIKDMVGIIAYSMVFVILVCWYPNLLGDPDNSIEAAPLSTPLSIVPE